MKLLLRKASHWFCVLFSPNLIDEQEKTCIQFLLEKRGILQKPGALQEEMFSLVRQYAYFNGLSDEEAVQRITKRAGLAQSETQDALRSLTSQNLLKGH
jgi:hypothetical protein